MEPCGLWTALVASARTPRTSQILCTPRLYRLTHRPLLMRS
jgi:hypothetical protein